MSLITDALNEAQREANKRRKEGQPALLGENPMASPPPVVVVAPPYRPWGRILVYAAIGVVIVASTVGGIIAYRRAQSESEAEIRARADADSSPATNPAPAVVASAPAAPKAPDTTARDQAAPTACSSAFTVDVGDQARRSCDEHR